jgi:hypothetical protein
MLRREVVVTETHLLERARPVRLDEHVEAAHEPAQHVGRARCLEVERHGALAAVERDVTRFERLGRHRAEAVTEARVLDLDHVGTEVGEERRAERAGVQP